PCLFMADFAQTLMTTLAVGSLYALIALGYTMVYGILKFINFAHSDIVVLGAWLAFTIAQHLLPALGYPPNAPPPIWVGGGILLASMTICGFVGFTIERLAYRPLRKAPRLNVLITAIGVSLLLQNLGQLDVTISDLPLIGKYLNSFLEMIPGIRMICHQHFGFGAIPQRMPDLLPK